MEQTLSSSMEDYLEAILGLQQAHAVARARDIGAQLGVNRSSVTTALHALSKRGLINYSPYDFITLTPTGLEAAQSVTQRHRVIRQFLTDILGLDEATADAAACKMEHAVSGVVLERLTAFMEGARAHPSPALKASRPTSASAPAKAKRRKKDV